MLELRNVRCGYGGGDVVKNISLKVEDGEFLCIVGPNGSGKSTLLKAIARLLPFRGGVLIDGRESAAFTRRELAKKIALMGQNASLYFPYTVYETVAMGRYAYRRGLLDGLSPACGNAIEQTLAALELDAERDRLISELSGGVLQRVFLARALVQNPDCVLLDEPANHLDLNYQVKCFDYLASGPFRHKTVIAVLHDLNLARRYAKNVLLMSEGRAAASGSAAEVFSGPALAEAYGMDIGGFMRDSLEQWGAV